MQYPAMIPNATRTAAVSMPPLFHGTQSQRLSRWVSPKWVSGERLLLAAILQRAVLDAVVNSDADQHQTERRRIGAEAKRWIFSNERHGFTSFVNICELLELDPGWVRNKVTSMDPTTIRRRGVDEAADLPT